MTTTRSAVLVAAVLAFAVSILLALLAADVVRTEQALEKGDVRFAGVAGTRGMWEPDTILPSGASRALLGLEDDVAYRQAVQRFRLAQPRQPVTTFAQLTVRSGAERVLAAAAREDADSQRGAAIANLRGALALEEARVGTVSGPALRRAIVHFRRAMELDPDNDDARFNLELALRLLSNAASSSAGSGERASTPASGAGAASSGSGY
jgi:hypothetical protein